MPGASESITKCMGGHMPGSYSRTAAHEHLALQCSPPLLDIRNRNDQRPPPILRCKGLLCWCHSSLFPKQQPAQVQPGQGHGATRPVRCFTSLALVGRSLPPGRRAPPAAPPFPLTLPLPLPQQHARHQAPRAQVHCIADTL
eukprot:jgi/Ulvmu1/5001/UM021_0018.1